MTLTATRLFLSGGAIDPQAEARFFNTLKMQNGTFKRTHGNRFDALETAFEEPLAERAGRIRDVLDLAVSSGVTSVDFSDYLTRLGARFRLVATDAFMSAHIVDIGAGIRILAASDGYPLQYDVCGIACRPWVRRLDYVTLGVVPRLAVRGLARRRAAQLIASGRSTPVQLVSPSLAARPEITLVESDILQQDRAFVGRFDVIRAANILNRGYFQRAALNRAIRHVLSYLSVADGLLIVTRTTADGQDNGTLFMRSGQRLEVLARVGSGSEIEGMILAASRSSAQTKDE